MEHLTLEQCRRLKEWGYPQGDTVSRWGFSSGYEIHFGRNFNLTEEGHLEVKPRPQDYVEEWTYVPYPGCFSEEDESTQYKGYLSCPTLEELIEWLGDDFNKLYKDTYQGRHFTAISDRQYPPLIPTGTGITPLQAAYALCEAIHTK